MRLRVGINAAGGVLTFGFSIMFSSTSCYAWNHVSWRKGQRHRQFVNVLLFRGISKPIESEYTRPLIPDLPSHPSQYALWVGSHAILSRFVNKNETYAKRHGQEPMFDRHLGRIQDVLKLLGVQPKEGHDESKQHGREQIPVLGVLVEQGRMLEDG